MKVLRKVIEIDEELCDGCGKCVPSCHEGAIAIVGGKARLVAERYCDGLGACLGECPRGALRIIERESEAFEQPPCPSARAVTVSASTSTPASGQSALTHWPVQIRLVSPAAPFLQQAHLLVTADCVPVACPRYHDDLLRGKVAMLGCPKFDNAGEYAARFADIFSTAQIKSVTVAVMVVPCCQGLPRIVAAGLAASGAAIPAEVVVVGFDGEIIERRPLVVN